jgi:hypothetical protein
MFSFVLNTPGTYACSTLMKGGLVLVLNTLIQRDILQANINSKRIMVVADNNHKIGFTLP